MCDHSYVIICDHHRCYYYCEVCPSQKGETWHNGHNLDKEKISRNNHVVELWNIRWQCELLCLQWQWLKIVLIWQCQWQWQWKILCDNDNDNGRYCVTMTMTMGDTVWQWQWQWEILCDNDNDNGRYCVAMTMTMTMGDTECVVRPGRETQQQESACQRCTGGTSSRQLLHDIKPDGVPLLHLREAFN